MIKVKSINVFELDLPLNSFKMVLKRNNKQRRQLRDFEKNYGVDSSLACRTSGSSYMFYDNVAYVNVPYELKSTWIRLYKNYVRSSLKYKFMIIAVMLSNLLIFK